MKILFILIGSISLALGVLGIFLPLLPTTPFLLLSAALFLRSSQRMYDWLVNHKYLGCYISSYLENRLIPVRVKIISVSLLWVSIILSVFLVDSLLVKTLLLLIAIGVTWHILSHKSTIE